MHTNDPKNAIIELKLSGTVKKFVTIKPNRAILRGYAGKEIKQVITIKPETEVPFKILQANALKGIDYKHSLKETKVNDSLAYELTVENIREDAGRYYDKIILLTDRTDHAPLSIIVTGDIKSLEVETQESGKQAVTDKPVKTEENAQENVPD